MKLLKGKKQSNCRECTELILSNDWKYKASEGMYCFYHGRIKSLHDGVMNWVRINFASV